MISCELPLRHWTLGHPVSFTVGVEGPSLKRKVFGAAYVTLTAISSPGYECMELYLHLSTC